VQALTDTVDLPRLRRTLLHAGYAIGIGALVTAAAVGVIAQVRPGGLAVTGVLAQSPLNLRASIILHSASVALVLTLLWTRLIAPVPAILRLRPMVKMTLGLCVLSPLLTMGANWCIVTGCTADHVALLPALSMVATAVLYAIVMHPLSGTAGTSLGARLVLRSGYVWLLVTSVLQCAWITSRVLLNDDRVLWFLERPTIEMGLLGFVAFSVIGVLMTNLEAVYHSRSLAQELMRSYQFANGMIIAWGLMEAWSLRYPASYQALAAALVGLTILITLTNITMSSGLLSRRALPGLSYSDSGTDGAWANGLASASLAMMVVGAALIATTGVVAAASGAPPQPELFASVLMAIGMGTLPLSAAAVMASMHRGLSACAGMGSIVVGAGALISLLLWSMDTLVDRPMAVFLAGAEGTIAIGLVIVLLCVLPMRLPAS
jgi:hypothetical protein